MCVCVSKHKLPAKEFNRVRINFVQVAKDPRSHVLKATRRLEEHVDVWVRPTTLDIETSMEEEDITSKVEDIIPSMCRFYYDPKGTFLIRSPGRRRTRARPSATTLDASAVPHLPAMPPTRNAILKARKEAGTMHKPNKFKFWGGAFARTATSRRLRLCRYGRHRRHRRAQAGRSRLRASDGATGRQRTLPGHCRREAQQRGRRQPRSWSCQRPSSIARTRLQCLFGRSPISCSLGHRRLRCIFMHDW